MLQGSIVALVTPMLADGAVDWARLDELVDWHLESGTSAIGAVGTTGESPTLSVEEHLGVIEAVVKRAAAGAAAALLIAPYYNKPTQEGLYQHFRAVAEATALPVILYNVPARTVTDLMPDTIQRLAQIDNVVGIKDATGSIDRGRQIMQRCGPEFALYSGDDPTATELIFNGALGAISVTANLVPQLMAELMALALAGKKEEALALDQRIQPLNQQMSLESNPIPVKWALYRMGKIDSGIRLPLTPLSEDLRPGLDTLLSEMQIIS